MNLRFLPLFIGAFLFGDLQVSEAATFGVNFFHTFELEDTFVETVMCFFNDLGFSNVEFLNITEICEKPNADDGTTLPPNGVTTQAPTTAAPTTQAPTTQAPTTAAPTTAAPTTQAPTTQAPTTQAPTTAAPTTAAPTTQAPTTQAPTTQVPTTQAPTTTTTLPPITTICTRIIRLNSVTSGTYLRSMCAVETVVSYAAANSSCIANRMRLLALEGKEIYDSFVVAMDKYQTDYYFFSPYIQFWINGIKTAPNTWKIYNPNENPLYSGVSWAYNDPNNGDRLTSLKNAGFTQGIRGQTVNDAYWYYCEFV